MDARTFLIRKDQKALDRRLKKNEKVRVAVQAKRGQDIGLLAATGTRILFVYKGRLRHKCLEIPGNAVQKVSERRGGQSEVHLGMKSGQTLRFTMLERGDGEKFCETIRPSPPVKTGQSIQTRKGGPMQFIPKQGRPAPSAQAKPHPRGQAHDPLSASKAQKLARLEELHKKGRIGKAEYEWQRDALR
ncbi:MAG: hypothetical protein ACPHID_08380 [Thermoplasmatota archaeon]